MKRTDIIVIALAAVTLSALFVTPANAAQITNAFSRIFIDGVNVFTARSYNDFLNFESGTGIDISYSSPNKITISNTAGPSGDTNTAQIGDEGTHLSIFGSRFNATKNLLKTIICTSPISCSTNSTDISITSSSSVDTNTAQIGNSGNGVSIFGSRVNATQNNLKTFRCSGLTCTSNSTDIILTTSGGVTTLASNVTANGVPTADVLVWTIPLTANSGNAVTGMIIANSDTINNAVQAGFNVTNLGTRGYCSVASVSTATSMAIDNIAMNTVLTGRATNTGETVWLSGNRPQPITFNCALTSGATAGNLRIWINNEVAGTNIAAKAGSYYIKTP